MRRIAVVTGTRAEYGVTQNILKAIELEKDLELQLIVTGTHLVQKYGYTIQEIENDGFPISAQIPILFEKGCENTMSQEAGLLILHLSSIFQQKRPDILLVVGDRYEAMAAAVTAMLLNIPIAHVSGGEITEGAIDEQIRHAITKLAHIHFPGMQEYANNIMNMGEEAWRIHMVGDPGIENLRLMKYLPQEELERELNAKINENTLLVTYHPVTLEVEQTHEQITNLIEALRSCNKEIIFTYPNADNGGNIIIEEIERFGQESSNVHIFQNLGNRKYSSIMKLCGAVVGNSSSAIIEAPFLMKPVVNIGNRQKGRALAKNIINCGNSCNAIKAAIKKALSPEYTEIAQKCESLYGTGNTSHEIIDVLKKIEIDERLFKKKLVWEK